MIRIAIVEDDTGYRSQLGKYIDQYQSDFSETVSVSEFSDGLEIVEKYKSEYDIILMDIQMKHMDGMQAAMRIRDMDKNVIIIFQMKLVDCLEKCLIYGHIRRVAD